MATPAVVLAHFDPADAAVIVAAISAFAVIFGPIALVLVSSLKRIREASERAAHNTQPNGHSLPDGRPSGPSPYDSLVASHEYMIGQIHEVAKKADAAVAAAGSAVIEVRRKSDALDRKIDAGFADAKVERDAIAGRLDQNVADGAAFAQAIIAGALGVVGRLDALDGKETIGALREQIEKIEKNGRHDDEETP